MAALACPVSWTSANSTPTTQTWVVWNAQHASTATATTAVTFSNTATWAAWCGTGTGAGSGSTIITSTSWSAWCSVQAETEEVRVKRWRDWFASAWANIGAETAKAAAKARAKKLLVQHLNKEQRKSYADRGFFYLYTKDKKYRIDQGTHGNVKLVDESNRVLGSYCIQPSGVPDEDAMLAQKLHIEHNEQEFLRVANFRRH